jgi:peptidoglycan-associated lipoprotein
MKLFLLLGIFTCKHFISFAQIRYSEPKKLSASINSSAEETTPILTSNGKELYFVRTFHQNNLGEENDQDIWKSELNAKGEWSKAENVVDLNNEMNNCLLALSQDGKTAFLVNSYSRKSSSFKAIAYSRIDQNGDWSKPKSFEFNFEGFENSISGFSISGDQKTIVFSAESKNSSTGKDLYISEFKNNIWSLPNRIEINSSKDEISPFLTEKGDTLFFASNGLPGFGNYDLFYSIRNENTNKWSNPNNLGNSLNSPFFDAYLTKVGSLVYWSSNPNGKDTEIYFAKIKTPIALEIELSKKDVSFFNGNDGMIELSIVSGTPPFKYKWSNGSMVEDLFKLRKGIYQVDVTDAEGQKTTKSIEVSEPKPELMSSFRLPEIRFEFGTWKFASSTDYDSLNTILELLNKYPEMIVELRSHTDSRGDEQVNMKLSENRAKAVYTFLVNQKGIDGRRIIPIGKGETEPSFHFDPTTNQKINLTGAYIDKFKTKDPNFYEFLHQQNRRIEARIISFDFDPISASPEPKEYLIQPK